MKAGFLRIMSIVAAPACAFGVAWSQQIANYPSKPIRVVAQPPGGSTDLIMRLYTQKVSEALGQPMVVDNRGGGGVASIVTLASVASANPDGYTMGTVVPNFTFLPALVKDLPFDPLKSFAPVTQLTRTPYAVVVNPGLPVKSVKDLIAFAKSQLGTLNFGAGNTGSGTHLITMYFVTVAGIRGESTYIPYKGVGPATLDVMAGRIQASVTTIVSSLPLVKSGKLRTLGITSAQRSRAFPDVPTIAEQGLPGFAANAFIGWVAPARTPAAILNKLSMAAARAAQSAEIADRVRDDGGDAFGSTPQEFSRFIGEEIPRWRALVRDLGISAAPE